MVSISKLLVLVPALILALANITPAPISFEWVTVGDPGNPNDPLTGFPNDGNIPTGDAVRDVYRNSLAFGVATVGTPPSSGLRNGDSIRFYPRQDYNARMVGGVFEGSTNGFSYTVLHTMHRSS